MRNGWPNLRLGAWSRLFAPGYGRCRACGTPWLFVYPHTTEYGRHTYYPTQGIGWGPKGCFPLCEKCWTERTIIQRLPYYWDHFLAGGHNIGSSARWKLIESAVFAGK